MKEQEHKEMGPKTITECTWNIDKDNCVSDHIYAHYCKCINAV